MVMEYFCVFIINIETRLNLTWNRNSESTVHYDSFSFALQRQVLD